MTGQVLHLLEHRPPWHVADAADNHPSGLAARVQIYRRDHR
jgi:hypothetical protein